MYTEELSGTAHLQTKGADIPVDFFHMNATGMRCLCNSHYHPHIEILYANDCKMVVIAGSEQYRVKTGDLMIIDPKKVHTIFSINDIADYYVLRFTPNVLMNDTDMAAFDHKYLIPFDRYMDTPYKKHFTAQELKNTDIPEIAEKYKLIWEEHKPGWELDLHILILNLYSQMLSLWNVDLTAEAVPENKTISDNLKTALNNSLKYIQLNYDTVSAAELADMYHFNYSYFLNAFKKYTGMPFLDYVRSIKLKIAENLLITTNLSISAIAMETGFSSSSQFISQFKVVKKVTPTKYRQISRQSKDTSTFIV